jgi:membrane protein YdbS with pleckstrin-like domain
MAVIGLPAAGVAVALLQDGSPGEKGAVAEKRPAGARLWFLRYVPRKGEALAMDYVHHILQSGEEVRHEAKPHWIIFAPGLTILLVAVVLAAVAAAVDIGSVPKVILDVAAALLALVAVVHLLQSWIVRWTTEIAVTNRRVILKTGLIRRDTNEMQMDKVESVKVDQSILGRILDYGDVTILGTGAGLEPLYRIAAPIALRNYITGM